MHCIAFVQDYILGLDADDQASFKHKKELRAGMPTAPAIITLARRLEGLGGDSAPVSFLAEQGGVRRGFSASWQFASRYDHGDTSRDTRSARRTCLSRRMSDHSRPSRVGGYRAILA
jgi:hypothetical protein